MQRVPELVRAVARRDGPRVALGQEDVDQTRAPRATARRERIGGRLGDDARGAAVFLELDGPEAYDTAAWHGELRAGELLFVPSGWFHEVENTADTIDGEHIGFVFRFLLCTAVSAVLVVAGDLAQQLRSQMRHDPLTEVLNRRGLEEAAASAIAQARRHDRPLALVICDLDGFKALNDNFGHIAGDQALKGFARLLILAVRRGDIVGRMGGDEFGLLLQDSDAQAAADVMERVRLEVAHLALPRVPDGALRASFGVAALQPTDRTLEDMVHRADEALYAAKKDGKNRVSIARAIA